MPSINLRQRLATTKDASSTCSPAWENGASFSVGGFLIKATQIQLGTYIGM